MALVRRPSACRLRWLTQSVVRGFGPRHFTCKFERKVALVKGPKAFPLRRLVQSVRPGLDP